MLSFDRWVRMEDFCPLRRLMARGAGSGWAGGAPKTCLAQMLGTALVAHYLFDLRIEL